MKKKKFPVFILCSLLTLTNIQTPWAFSDEAPDDPVFSDESVDDPVFPVELPAQKSVFLPCQSIPWKASNIFII